MSKADSKTNLKYDILELFDSFSMKIDEYVASELAKRCSSAEAALNYYLEHSNLFDNVESTENTTVQLVIDVDDAVDVHELNEMKWPQALREYENNAVAVGLLKIGFSTDQILYALPRSSSVEGAVSLFSPVVNLVEPTFPCAMCRDSFEISDTTTLQCNHRFCKECFVGYCRSKITEAQVRHDELVCPAVDDRNKICSQSITLFEVKANVPVDIFDKYERFSLKNFCEYEKMRSCPKCNEWYVDVQFLIQTENEWGQIECGACKHTFCGKCGQTPHKNVKDMDIDCAAYQQWLKDNGQGDTAFEAYVKEQKIFPCPKCKRVGALESGCKYLYCICKNHYCALCGVQLKEPQHHSHFTNGPFGDKCKGVTDTAGVD